MDRILLYYLAAVNAAAFLASLGDKLSAIRGGRRVPERALLLLAAAGGSVGLYLSMYLFRHKTRHARFTVGVPAIMAVQLLALYFLLRR